MITSIYIDHNLNTPCDLNIQIRKYCPTVKLLGQMHSLDESIQTVSELAPDLLFLGLEHCSEFDNELLTQSNEIGFETIIISSMEKLAVEAIKSCAVGFLIRPINEEDLIIAVNNAHKRIEARKKWIRDKVLVDKLLNQYSTEEIIGVPTMEGFEFLKIRDIIRCEGLQKCTRVVTRNRQNIVSSYNLGEFRKILEPFGFYSPHKSYLVNLQLITKYYKEGSLTMIDGVSIPVAKRKKSEFVNQIRHI